MLFFYMHQTSGASAGMCTCDHTNQMNNTVSEVHQFTDNINVLQSDSSLEKLAKYISI